MDECGYIEASPFQGLEEIEIQKDTGILGMGKSVNSQTKKLTYFKNYFGLSKTATLPKCLHRL